MGGFLPKKFRLTARVACQAILHFRLGLPPTQTRSPKRRCSGLSRRRRHQNVIRTLRLTLLPGVLFVPVLIDGDRDAVQPLFIF